MPKSAVLEDVAKGSSQTTVPLTRLFASPNNPRQIADDRAQEDLNADVARRGVLVPLIVRKAKDGKYEVLAGSRRLYAAKKAGKKEVPVRIVSLDDDQAHEVMVVENLQRQDIHPLDEAEHFKMLLDRSGGDVLALSERVNKKKAYIIRALALNQLVEPFRGMFKKGAVVKDAAFMVARLQPADQKKLADEAKAQKVAVLEAGDVQQFTQMHVLRDLTRVPWDCKDAELVPKAGACTTCPKRTGVAKDMFQDVTSGDTCTDTACFQTKLDTHMKKREREMGTKNVHYKLVDQNRWENEGDVLGTKSFLEAGQKKCETTMLGLVVAGVKVGHTIWICTNHKCKTHRPGLGNNGERVSADDAEKLRDQRKDRVRETIVRDKVLTAIVNKTTMGVGGEDMRLILTAVYGRLWHEHKKRYLKRRGLMPVPSRVKVEAPPDYDALFLKSIEKVEGPAFAKALIEIALLDEVDPGVLNVDGDRLYETAKRFQIDVATIKKDVAEHERQKAPKKKAKVKAKSK